MNLKQIEDKASSWSLNYNERVLLLALMADPTGYVMNPHVQFVIQGKQFDFFNAVESLVRAEIIEVRSDANGLAYGFLGDRQDQSDQG